MKNYNNENIMMMSFLVFSLFMLIIINQFAKIEPQIVVVEKPEVKLTLEQYGVASWYDYDLTNNLGYSKLNSTCASRFFKRGTMLKVENIKDNKSVVCRVNDYIEHPERVIDLSSYAFKQIAPLGQGLADVKITIAN